MMNFHKKIVLLSFFFIALTANAIGPEAGQMSLSVSPQYPAPGETFTVKVKSFTFDPLRANFQWILNGKLAGSGTGLSEQKFTASNLGTTMTITASATISDGTSYTAPITINISDLDLIVNPLTYTPLFYRGSALASPDSTVEIYAMPHLYSAGSKIPSKNLIFEWFVDGKKSITQSGQNKNKFVIPMADSGAVSHDVQLKVSSLGGSISSQKNIRVRTQNPIILFYETNSLTGRKQDAKFEFPVIAGSSIELLAEPFFFNTSSLPKAVISWSANGSIIENTSVNPKILEVLAPPDTLSSSGFGFVINDKSSIHQQAEGSLIIKVVQ